MADSTITNLPNQATPSGTARIPLDESGATSYSTKTQLFADEVASRTAADAVLEASINTLTSDKANNANPIFTGTVTVPAPAVGGAATTKTYVDTAAGLRLLKTGGTMSGDIDMDGNTITGLDAPTLDTDAARKSYVDDEGLSKASVLENYDPTGTGEYPTTWGGGAIKKGNRHYITAAGTITAGGTPIAVQIGDILEARQDAAENNHGHWSIIQANDVQATESVVGNTAYASDAEALAKSSQTKALKPSNLAALGASSTFAGLAEIATQAEVTSGTDDERYVTPLKLTTHLETAGIKTTNFTISSAEILALNAVPKLIINSPGANKVIELINVVAKNDFNSVAYAGAGTVDVGFSGGDTRWRFNNAFLTAASDLTTNGTPQSAIIMSENTSVVVRVTTADPTLGDGIIKMSIQYKIISV
jgi:hypothetical protein